MAAAAGLIGYLVAVLIVPGLRRHRRRRQGIPRARGLGAWHDVLDELAYLPARHATARQLRTATPGSTGQLLRHRCAGIDAEIRHLTRTTEACMLGAKPPSDAQVARAWTAATRIRHRLRRRAAWYSRLRRSISWYNLRLQSPWS